MKRLALIGSILSLISIAFAADNAAITTQYLNSIQHDPLKLQQFFYAMPKGGDIHNHIDGAVYAEDLVHFAAKENYCLNVKSMTVSQLKTCPAGDQLTMVNNNPMLLGKLIDAWSMQDFPINTQSGEGHFFNTFPKLEPLVISNVVKAIASIANRAGRQNEEYLELMIGGLELNVTDKQVKTPEEIGATVQQQSDLAAWRIALLAAGLNDVIKKTDIRMQQLTGQVNTLLKCGTSAAAPGCRVAIRYQYFALRDLPISQFYAELVTAFGVANTSASVVGINIVMPENWNTALDDYTEQMKMIGFLRTIYPKVHVTLHAGELTFGQLPPKYLTYHINQAVNIAHAERIGHGVDIAYEKNSQSLLNEMAQKHIDVEINLTSNKDVLGVSGKQSPLLLYLANQVPVTLSTDDEGIERTDLTAQYQLAELEYSLPYPILKNIVRNNLAYGFVEGKPLWLGYDYKQVVSQCATDILGDKNPSAACATFLKANTKARLQWQLEHEFNVFEASIANAIYH